MKFKTFIQIYYSHRLAKASLLKKFYLNFTLPFIYLLNKFYYPKIKNLDHFSINHEYLFHKDLNYLFQYFNSDKGDFYINQYQKPAKRESKLIPGHSYNHFYYKYFKKKKLQYLNILELGSFRGNAAAALFFYFKNAQIWCGDIFPDLFTYKSKRIKNFLIDTSSELELKNKIINKDENFDFIIEDAGHYLKDQIISLFILFRKLKPKGIFIVEELDFPDVRKDMNLENEKPTLKEILNLIKKNKDFDSKYINNNDKKYFIDNLKEINIFKGRFNEIVFIEKK